MAEQQKATSMQVARLAGVSQSAVSRAFTPGASVSEKMRRRVLEAARKLSYQPNAIARSLITRRSNMMGIVIANITTNPFYPDVLDALSRRFQERGQRVMLFVVTRDGFDDISMAAWPSYNLTTIRQPVVPMMDESVEVLLRRVEDPEAPFVNRLIPGDLVVRGSARLPKGVSSGWVITKEQDHE